MIGNPKILIVDDHQLIIQGLLCSLEEVGDFEVVTTSDCDDALHLIKASEKNAPFQVVFTDLSFDNATQQTNLKGGEELIKAIRKNKIDIKIGVITGHTETNRVYNVISNLNPNAYLLKSKCDATEIGALTNTAPAQSYQTLEGVASPTAQYINGALTIDDNTITIVQSLEGIIVKAFEAGSPDGISKLKNRFKCY